MKLIGSPLTFSRTPVRYLRHPPRLGEHTASVLRELLGMEEGEIGRLAEEGVIGPGGPPG